MTPSESDGAFRKYCAELGVPLDAVSVEAAIRAVIGFYCDVRAEDVDLQDGGDMLLYQWGTYAFSRPPTFQFNLTRQFCVEETDDDEGISQLSLTLHYSPAAEFHDLKGNRWCRSLAGTSAFETFIRDSDAFRALEHSSPIEVEVYWELV